jgi:valyl-tRNA synthetase
MPLPEKFLKPYNPNETEEKIYKLWEESGFFNPDICVEKEVTKKDAASFSIILPPPNVTGELHMGHASMLAIEDIIVRFERMRGKKTLWVPGTDHAAIATQSKVEKILEKEEGKRRHDLGREEFLKRVDDFAKRSHDTIVNQVKKMGSSLDWSREAFTLDEKRSLAVRTAFKKMYDLGLIYRGNRVINWDPKGQTVISDDEVVYEERKTKLYTFKYSKDFPISISTTRPETKVGDTAVAVNPRDERYKEYVGREFDLEFAGVPIHIKIVADESVDPEFGTGALGVTPAHSIADWEIAQRHNLPLVQVINEYAKMTVSNPELNGKKASEARETIADWLRRENLMEKEEEITQNISTAERTGGIIEPLPKLQWFVAVNKKFKIPHSEIEGIKTGQEVTLKELMLASVKNGQIKAIPDRFEKIYFHWIENLRDWCISRQIWYGHRIPAWYHKPLCIPIPGREKEIEKCEQIIVGEEIRDCPHCAAKFVQDEDTLDTWFSSGLWTFSTLGWPEETKDLKTYHPTQVLETGYDILFFWVARMILMSTCLLGQIPFHSFYLHGLVRDSKGRKISKSLGNNIDPIDVIAKYGADATRMSLVIGTAPGNDSKISDEKLKAYKHFANKIWNITRFILENVQDFDFQENISDPQDKLLLEEFEGLKKDITKELESFHFYLAGEKLYHYIWNRFADIIIEESKQVLKADSPQRKSRQSLLVKILGESLKMLHPFMPFVTEEIWQAWPAKKSLLLVETWPE